MVCLDREQQNNLTAFFFLFVSCALCLAQSYPPPPLEQATKKLMIAQNNVKVETVGLLESSKANESSCQNCTWQMNILQQWTQHLDCTGNRQIDIPKNSLVHEMNAASMCK